jgi:prevent-host-death family protein
MSVPSALTELYRVDEPQEAGEYSDVLNRVAKEHRPIVVRRDGADLAAVIPLEHLEVLREALAWHEAEKLAAQIDWDRVVKTHKPPQSWFDGDEPKPFEPDAQAVHRDQAL